MALHATASDYYACHTDVHACRRGTHAGACPPHCARVTDHALTRRAMLQYVRFSTPGAKPTICVGVLLNDT